MFKWWSPNNTLPEKCWCNPGYVLDNTSCIKCSDNRAQCEYNKENNTTKCIQCYDGYALNKENECSPCLEGCLYCYLDSIVFNSSFFLFNSDR